MWADLQTMQMTYQQMVQGERPWTALGDFLNYWHAYAADRRSELVHDPLQEPVEVTPELHRWAAFCAASVEFLCQTDAIPCPQWIDDPTYILPESWFTGLGATKPHVQERLKQEAPEPFTRRNIYCSPRAFANKYAAAASIQRQTA
jgi:hypothetical protein